MAPPWHPDGTSSAGLRLLFAVLLAGQVRQPSRVAVRQLVADQVAGERPGHQTAIGMLALARFDQGDYKGWCELDGMRPQPRSGRDSIREHRVEQVQRWVLLAPRHRNRACGG
jgi:hypothetical protein